MTPLSGLRSLQTLAGAALLVGVAMVVSGCGQEAAAPAVEAPPAVVVDPSSVATAISARLETGPMLSGSLEADREATVRAEVAGTILSIHAEEGQQVERGAVLARIDAAGVREQELSARSAKRSAEQQLEVARRNAERAEALLQSGALPPREAENARWNVMQAEAAVADSGARLALASEQVAKSTVRSPFSGVVSRRGVKAGDTVPPGAALFTIVDPRTMRLEAMVPAERFAQIKVGAPVVFRPSGASDLSFVGSVDRINPVADPMTRQVAVYARLPNAEGRLLPGMFVEGRIATETRQALSLPSAAIDRSGTRPFVLAVRDGGVVRVEVALGVEDEASERVEISEGLTAGESVLVGPARTLAPGTRVTIREATQG